MTAIDGEMSLGGKLEPMLTLSWFVRVQVGAKRGKLTLLGGVRGTKLELKGALGEPKSAPRASQEHPKRVSGASAAQTSSFIAFRGSRRPKPRVCTVSNLAFYCVWGTVAAQTSNFTIFGGPWQPKPSISRCFGGHGDPNLELYCVRRP